ncbi:MAG: peptidoglycan DD-metalloendopeptidase family protein, partial [Anaerolineae bacterium]|nr:peptidoglycan DD-metalloendopeptidase family protein [Anaerolineae bacterium]
PRSTQIMLQVITPTPAPGALFDQTGEIRDHYWLARPFPRDPSGEIRDYASRNYPYGTTGGGGFSTHLGLDFENGFGTGILATGSGTVLYAGNDSVVQFGPRIDYYGNLVVIHHDMLTPDGEALYTLYGHMSRLSVATGEYVELQQQIGQVGSTGVALGSHLHLEVRIGNPYDYMGTVNPDLWVRPWARFGTLAGRIYDADGNRLYNTNITLQRVGIAGSNRYTYAYADDVINPDTYYGEHFVAGDLPAGEYQVTVRIRRVLRFKGTVTVEAGHTAWIEIRLN